MVVCPSCRSAEHVHIHVNRTGADQWTGHCDSCDHTWTFSDDL